MAYIRPPLRDPMELVDASDYNADITENFKAAAPGLFTTKGDLIVATAADVGARLAAGANGSVLMTDTTENDLLRWTIRTGKTNYAEYYVSADTSIANNTPTILNFDTAVLDGDSAVTTGAAWKYTAPVAGLYAVCAMATWATTTAWDNSDGSENCSLSIFKNGTTSSYRYGRIDIWRAAINTVADFPKINLVIRLTGTILIDLLATDYFSVKVNQNCGSALNVTGGATNSWITIARIA